MIEDNGVVNDVECSTEVERDGERERRVARHYQLRVR